MSVTRKQGALSSSLLSPMLDDCLGGVNKRSVQVYKEPIEDSLPLQGVYCMAAHPIRNPKSSRRVINLCSYPRG